MGIAHLPQWDITAIEITLDLETPRASASSGFLFSGAGEPRICLVATFALTSQLLHIAAAVDRVVPARLPATLRAAPANLRTGRAWAPNPVAIQPMVSLLRLQRRLIRAIDPGLAEHVMREKTAFAPPGMDVSVAEYIRTFIPAKTLPVFEPAYALGDFTSVRLRAVGLTIYRLGNTGAPESILKHWAYAPAGRGSVPLRSGP